jgi:nitrate/TMAO reductase-like tetraheme cytochrome c subunit
MMRFVFILVAFVAVLGCEIASQHGQMASTPPKPIAVRPFSIAKPDAVLLVTGGTNGRLEVCNCQGPMPGGQARRSGLVASYRNTFPGALLVSVGDSFWVEGDDLMNLYLMKTYRLMGYDAVTLGDQEWAASDAFLARAIPTSDTAWLSTTVKSTTPAGKSLPLANEVLRTLPSGKKLCILSDLQRDTVLFMDKARLKQLQFTPHAPLAKHIAQRKVAGYTVVVVLHTAWDDADAAVKTLDADLYLRGHMLKCADKPRRVGGKWMIESSNSDCVGAVAMTIDDAGRITKLDYRAEVVTDRWPLDRRMLDIYQAYARDAMRDALDAKRKTTRIKFVPSSKCGQCHKTEYTAWTRSPHARAFATLQTAKRTGDPNCVSCHSLGFGLKGGFYTFEKTPTLGGVHCQNCHRLGIEEHASKAKAKTFFKANPTLAKPTDKVCTTCHSPVTDPKFNDNTKRKFHSVRSFHGKK